MLHLLIYFFLAEVFSLVWLSKSALFPVLFGLTAIAQTKRHSLEGDFLTLKVLPQWHLLYREIPVIQVYPHEMLAFLIGSLSTKLHTSLPTSLRFSVHEHNFELKFELSTETSPHTWQPLMDTG